MKNITLKENFNQVCVWPGTIMPEDQGPKEFEKFMKKELKARVQFLEVIETNPDMEGGEPVEDTGGRSDLFFAIHTDDVMGFAIPRLQVGIRWIEDVYGNGGGYLYPARVAEYKTW